MNPPEVDRLLYEMAKEAKGGMIVELGSFRGSGTIILCRGSSDGNGMPVYSIDDFEYRTGWIGEIYGSENAILWHNALKEAGYKAFQIRKEFHERSFVKLKNTIFKNYS